MNTVLRYFEVTAKQHSSGSIHQIRIDYELKTVADLFHKLNRERRRLVSKQHRAEIYHCLVLSFPSRSEKTVRRTPGIASGTLHTTMLTPSEPTPETLRRVRTWIPFRHPIAGCEHSALTTKHLAPPKSSGYRRVT
jgi:hypothetical protein